MREEDIINRQFYVVREVAGDNRYYLNGSGNGATPKLYYSKGTAEAVANRLNRRAKRNAEYRKEPIRMTYEAVPATLIIGMANGNQTKG